MLAWWVATPWSSPVWPLLTFVPVPLAVWWLATGVRRVTAVLLVVVIIVVVVGTVTVVSSALPGSVRYGATLDGLEVLAAATLENLSPPAEGCGAAPPADYGVLGTPERVCVVVYRLGLGATPVATGPPPAGLVARPANEVRQVRFDWGVVNGVPDRQLVFEGGVAQPVADRCVRLVRDPWWAWLVNDGGCPSGFVSSTSG